MSNIICLPNWLDTSTYFRQGNNPTENYNRKTSKKIILETCGPTSLINGVVLVKGEKFVEIKTRTGYLIPPESVAMAYFHTEKNYSKFYTVRPYDDFKNQPFNRIPQYHPLMLNDIFDIESEFIGGGLSFKIVCDLISHGIAVEICLIKPGHYVTIGAVNLDTKEIGYRDPWVNNYFPRRLKGVKGCNKFMTLNEFEKNTKKWYVTIGEAA